MLLRGAALLKPCAGNAGSHVQTSLDATASAAHDKPERATLAAHRARRIGFTSLLPCARGDSKRGAK